MAETTEAMEAPEGLLNELERLFAGRLARPIAVQYGVIHVEVSGQVSGGDVEGVYRVLDKAGASASWRMQQVGSLLLVAREQGD